MFASRDVRIAGPGDPLEREARRIAMPGSAGSLPARGSLRRDEGTAPPEVRRAVASPGRPLDDATRAAMERRLPYDFSEVRIHTDARAAESAEAVNALAYTVGRDVVFARGRYDPHTPRGRDLLAHELVHTTQGAPDRVFRQHHEEESTETTVVEDDATVLVPEGVSRDTLREIVRDHPVIGRRLVYRSDEGDHADRMLRDHSNLDEVHDRIARRHGPVRLRFRFTYERIRGTDPGRGWRVRHIEIVVRDQVDYEEGHVVEPDPPPDLRERIERASPVPPEVDLPPDTPSAVLRQIGSLFWDPENASSPDDLLPSVPGESSAVQSLIENNLRNLRNADAIQRSGAEHLGYADAVARWTTGTDVGDLTTVPPDMRARMMGLSLSLAGYRAGAARAVRFVSGLRPESVRQGAQLAIGRRYGYTRARIREGLLGEISDDMSPRLRALMPSR